MVLEVVTWNLFHGRADPPAGRPLLDEFAATLAGWSWDVALLQEVPPWWPAPLARACDAEQRHVLTSRNELLPVRRWVAERWPDLIKSNGGGANAMLVRGHAIGEHRTLLLRRWPERRWMHALQLGADGPWIANLHGSTPPGPRPRGDLVAARATLDVWAGAGAAAVLGGDLNLRQPRIDGYVHAAVRDVDHLWARGFTPAGPARRLERGTLSDHVPLAVTLVPAGG